MKFALFPKTCAKAGKPVFEAFRKSLRYHNVWFCENTDLVPVDIGVMWSVLTNMYGRKPIYDYYKTKVILEVGGLKRNQTWKVAINGINRDAYFGNTDVDDRRWKQFNFNLRDWRQNGDHIIVCGQNPQSEAWDLPDISQWWKTVISEIRKVSDRKIILRPHPRSPVNFKITESNVEIQQPKFVGEYDKFNFVESLKNAWAVVNHNSNPAIEAVIHGIPVFVGESSLCYDVGNHSLSNIENPLMPDRTKWCNEIAYTEWTVEEIEEGVPLQRLIPKLEEMINVRQ